MIGWHCGPIPTIPRSLLEPGSLGKIITLTKHPKNQKRASPLYMNIQRPTRICQSSNHVAFGSWRLHQATSGAPLVKFLNVSPSPLKLIPRSILQSQTSSRARANDVREVGASPGDTCEPRNGLIQDDPNRGRDGRR